MKEEWLMAGAVVPVDVETTAALVAEIKRLIDVVGGMALAQPAPMQEPWESSDTAHRPGGLPQDFIKHEVENEGDWSEWVNPDPEQYFMKCCDCGLVHEMQFKVAKYSEGDECEFVADANLQAVFRARRVAPSAQPEREQEPVLWMMPDGKTADKWALQFYGGQKGKPLYTSPQPQRELVGLTDAEIENLWQKTWHKDSRMIYDFARAIEAAHNIKE